LEWQEEGKREERKRRDRFKYLFFPLRIMGLDNEEKFGIVFLIGIIIGIPLATAAGLGGIILALIISASLMFSWVKLEKPET